MAAKFRISFQHPLFTFRAMAIKIDQMTIAVADPKNIWGCRPY